MSNNTEKTDFFEAQLYALLEHNEFSVGDKKTAAILFDGLNDYSNNLHEFKDVIKSPVYDAKLLRSSFYKVQRKLLSDIHSFEKKTDSRVLQKKVRDIFQSALTDYLFTSAIVKRAYEKPRGYPGDHLIFEMIYNRDCASEGMGYFLDHWIMNHALTRGTIYRKNRVKKILKEVISGSRNTLDILNLGCGSSREVRELYSDRKMNMSRVHFTCLDQDEDALRLSEKFISKIDGNPDISFLKHDIVSICLNRNSKRIAKQDIIYSLGIADYLLKTTLENFIMFCHDLLKPRGKLIIALCSSHNPKLYIPLRWFADWSFFSHRADDIKKFIKNELHLKKVQILWEDRKPIFFVIIEK